ncbi:hypothetical protein [Vibrio astriarenae]|uniref:hypothetical protein n=1 Tax=Vibrio astriarenae TaxID=1481923 RepID=UPI0037352A3A
MLTFALIASLVAPELPPKQPRRIDGECRFAEESHLGEIGIYENWHEVKWQDQKPSVMNIINTRTSHHRITVGTVNWANVSFQGRNNMWIASTMDHQAYPHRDWAEKTHVTNKLQVKFYAFTYYGTHESDDYDSFLSFEWSIECIDL